MTRSLSTESDLATRMSPVSTNCVCRWLSLVVLPHPMMPESATNLPCWTTSLISRINWCCSVS